MFISANDPARQHLEAARPHAQKETPRRDCIRTLEDARDGPKDASACDARGHPRNLVNHRKLPASLASNLYLQTVPAPGNLAWLNHSFKFSRLTSPSTPPNVRSLVLFKQLIAIIQKTDVSKCVLLGLWFLVEGVAVCSRRTARRSWRSRSRRWSRTARERGWHP
jgi:hypothetical protein